MKHVLCSDGSGIDENSAIFVNRSWTHDSYFSLRRSIHLRVGGKVRGKCPGEKCPDATGDVFAVIAAVFSTDIKIV